MVSLGFGKLWASQMALVITCLPMQETSETQVQSLGQEDPLEEGLANHPSILAWRIQWTEESGVLQSMESQRVRNDWSNLARTQKAIVDETGSMSPNHDLFLVHVCFGKYFGASSWSNHWARHHWLSYKNPFSLHVTIEMRNGSLLLHRIREDTSKRRHFWFVVSYWGTHLLSFFTFPICFKCQMTLECSKLSSWTTSHVVLRE